jgi:hypothetical protein
LGEDERRVDETKKKKKGKNEELLSDLRSDRHAACCAG